MLEPCIDYADRIIGVCNGVEDIVFTIVILLFKIHVEFWCHMCSMLLTVPVDNVTTRSLQYLASTARRKLLKLLKAARLHYVLPLRRPVLVAPPSSFRLCQSSISRLTPSLYAL